MNAIARLTWRHPKLVLAVVAAFAFLAVAVGSDVESHLKAAGFTDPGSESEQATDALRESLGYDPNPAIVLVVRAPDGGTLDLRDPAVRREVAEVNGEIARVRFEVDDAIANDAELAKKHEEVCPVDIFKATDSGVKIVEENLDECLLCNLCVDAAPDGSVRVVKL